MYFTFTIRANAPDGIYYPTFYIDFLQAGVFRFPVKLTVESTELQVSILNKPDVFSKEKKEDIHLIIGNPRDNPATGILVIPSGTGIEATQTFVGKLDPDMAANVTVEVTPYEEGEVTFDVRYKNGINEHTSSLTIPVVFGEGKKRAEPVLNNIEVRSNGGYYIVTGDVTNAGLETAYSVAITVGEPGIPVDPYQTYVVGGLDPDDFSSFEVTFKPGNATSVPLLVQYRAGAGSFGRSDLHEEQIGPVRSRGNVDHTLIHALVNRDVDQFLGGQARILRGRQRVVRCLASRRSDILGRKSRGIPALVHHRSQNPAQYHTDGYDNQQASLDILLLCLARISHKLRSERVQVALRE